MASGSFFKAIDTKVAALIAARTLIASSNVAVSRGDPLTDVQREHIWTEDMNLPDETVAALGNNTRDEEIEINIIVRVQHEGNDSAEARDRAADLVDEVEEALRADPTLTNTAFAGGWVTQGALTSGFDGQARIAVGVLTAKYHCRKG